MSARDDILADVEGVRPLSVLPLARRRRPAPVPPDPVQAPGFLLERDEEGRPR